jgi:hypothetical protein
LAVSVSVIFSKSAVMATPPTENVCDALSVFWPRGGGGLDAGCDRRGQRTRKESKAAPSCSPKRTGAQRELSKSYSCQTKASAAPAGAL